MTMATTKRKAKMTKRRHLPRQVGDPVSMDWSAGEVEEEEQRQSSLTLHKSQARGAFS